MPKEDAACLHPMRRAYGARAQASWNLSRLCSRRCGRPAGADSCARSKGRDVTGDRRGLQHNSRCHQG